MSVFASSQIDLQFEKDSLCEAVEYNKRPFIPTFFPETVGEEVLRKKISQKQCPAFKNTIFNIYGYNDISEFKASNSFTCEDLSNKNNSLSYRGRGLYPISNRKTENVAE